MNLSLQLRPDFAAFDFVVRNRISCWYLNSEAQRRLYCSKPDTRHSDEWRTLMAWVQPFLKTPGKRPVRLRITLTNRTDHDLSMLCILRDATAAVLTGRTSTQPIGPTVTRELTRLLRKLDDFMDTPIVERVASLA